MGSAQVTLSASSSEREHAEGKLVQGEEMIGKCPWVLIPAIHIPLDPTGLEQLGNQAKAGETFSYGRKFSERGKGTGQEFEEGSLANFLTPGHFLTTHRLVSVVTTLQ